MNHSKVNVGRILYFLGLATGIVGTLHAAEPENYYTEPSYYLSRPDPKSERHFGNVGVIGLQVRVYPGPEIGRCLGLAGLIGAGASRQIMSPGGMLNAAGAQLVTTMLLAKECGVNVDENTLVGALRFYYRFAGRGSVAYGDHRPEGWLGSSNGKDGMAAAIMQVACDAKSNTDIYRKAR